MSIERLRALEIELRNEAEAKQLESQDKNWSEWVRDRAHGRSAGLHEAASRIQQLIAELGQEVGAVAVPDGWALVPKEMRLSSESIALIAYMCGGDEDATEEDERWLDGILWVGETQGDNGEAYWGLNIACVDLLDEGSVPVCEFARPTSPAHTSEARDWEGVEHVASHIENAVDYITKQYPDARMLDRAPIMRNMRRWARNLRAAMRQEAE